jgi:ATP-dependent DNA ligase
VIGEASQDHAAGASATALIWTTKFPRTVRSVAVLVAYLASHVAAYLPGRVHVPCLPTKTNKLPSGSQWLHEIKHDGFRIIARKGRDRCGSTAAPAMT